MTALSLANETKGKVFNQKLMVHRQGKDIIVDEWIQSGKEGTNIYDVIEKYGMAYAMNTMGIAGLKGITEDISGIHNLQDVLMMNKKAIEGWQSLPADLRKEFGNNRLEFAKNGKKWLENKIKSLEPKKDLSVKEENNIEATIKKDGE